MERRTLTKVAQESLMKRPHQTKAIPNVVWADCERKKKKKKREAERERERERVVWRGKGKVKNLMLCCWDEGDKELAGLEF